MAVAVVAAVNSKKILRIHLFFQSTAQLQYVEDSEPKNTSPQTYDTVGWKGIWPAKSECWFVGGDILTGALHDLQLQLSPPSSSSLAPIKSRMETVWYRLTQVHLEMAVRERERERETDRDRKTDM